MSKLTLILDNKRLEVTAQKKFIPKDVLEQSPRFRAHSRKLKPLLEHAQTPKIIAEVKRFSPNAHQLHPFASAQTTALGYQTAKASAISVLTDTRFFGGSLTDLQVVSDSVSLPVLQKDFIVDEYQLYQAKAFGADIVLLIASALSPKLYEKLAIKAHHLDLEVLLELHPGDDYQQYNLAYVDFVGVNNRNLNTFETDLYHSVKMAEVLPKSVIKISESGLTHPQDVHDLFGLGYQGMLIGTHFMKTPNPADTCASFVRSLEMFGAELNISNQKTA